MVLLLKTYLFMVAIVVRVHSVSGEPIEGATVRMERDGVASAEAMTDKDGNAQLPNFTEGQYVLSVAKKGFELSSQVLLLQDARQEIDVDFALPPRLTRNDNIDVVADLDPLKGNEASPASVELQTTELTLLPTRPATVADSLPLVPGVNRGANGEIRISGEGEQRSALVVNSSDVTDPTSGRFSTTVPVGSVESIDVFKTPFLPQYGKFTTGVVAVQTRRGGETWHRTLKEPFPDFRVRSGHIRGLRDATPKFTISGPVVHNALYLSQSIDYSLEKKQVRTLSFPTNESKAESLNSFSQLDYIMSANHFVTGTLHFTPQHTNFVDPQFFNPQPVTPSFRGFQGAWTFIDHFNGSVGLLESSLSHQIFRARVGSQGTAEMVLTPTGNLGNYFATQTRDSSRVEWLETFSRRINARGSHDLKFGTVIAQTANSGAFAFRPVAIRDQNQRPIQRIEFMGGTPFDHADVEHAMFAQDHWAPRSNFAVDGGLRVEHQTTTSTWRMAPRVGAAWTPLSGGDLVVRGGVGMFYDRVPLAVYSFPHFPQQVITTYDASGQVVGKPRRFANVIETESGKRIWLLKSRETSGNFAPYSQTWTLQVDRRVAKVIRLRVGYQHSDGNGGMIVIPKTFGSGGANVLEGGGRSQYRQFEVTARVTWGDSQQMMFSYVHSKSRGDLSAFNSYVGDYPAIPLRPNVFSNLPGDLPHRFISWGVLNLPWKLQMAPVLEYRTGAPYAVIDAARNYVGIPFSDQTRLRNYFSADVRFSKIVPLLQKYRARISVASMNLTNHFNSLDAHANIADPQFGVLFGHYKRRYRADFELLF